MNSLSPSALDITVDDGNLIIDDAMTGNRIFTTSLSNTNDTIDVDYRVINE
jgi:hypothetical protein